MPGEFVTVFAAGNEKLRYVAGSILVIPARAEPRFVSLSSDDPKSLLEAAGYWPDKNG